MNISILSLSLSLSLLYIYTPTPTEDEVSNLRSRGSSFDDQDEYIEVKPGGDISSEESSGEDAEGYQNMNPAPTRYMYITTTTITVCTCTQHMYTHATYEQNM